MHLQKQYNEAERTLQGTVPPVSASSQASVATFVYLSLCLSSYLSAYLSIIYPSISPSIPLSLYSAASKRSAAPSSRSGIKV